MEIIKTEIKYSILLLALGLVAVASLEGLAAITVLLFIGTCIVTMFLLLILCELKKFNKHFMDQKNP